MTERKEPVVSKALIEWIKELVPRPLYGPEDSINRVMHEEGRQSLIEFLESIHERQKER